MVVGLDACTREYIGLKVLDDLNVGSQCDIAPSLSRALGRGVSIQEFIGQGSLR